MLPEITVLGLQYPYIFYNVVSTSEPNNGNAVSYELAFTTEKDSN